MPKSKAVVREAASAAVSPDNAGMARPAPPTGLTREKVMPKKAVKKIQEVELPEPGEAALLPTLEYAEGGPIKPDGAYVIGESGPETVVVSGVVVPPADIHVIPPRDYTRYRQHDAVRGCWCFPEIEGNEVLHR